MGAVGQASPTDMTGNPTQSPGPLPTRAGGLVIACPSILCLMGGWFSLIALGLCLVLIGLYLHWSVILLGALLPFIPVVAEWLRRRRR